MLAEVVAYPDDYSWVKYRLRKEAHWHDGKPVTLEDVIFSIEALKKYSPLYSAYYRHVAKTEKTGEREITFTFDAPGNRELPTIVGELTVLPKHWWEGTDSERQEARYLGNDAGEAARLRSLPDQGIRRGAIGRRRAGKGLLGRQIAAEDRHNNFDEQRFEFFRDNLIALEAFKARSGRLDLGELGQAMGDRL